MPTRPPKPPAIINKATCNVLTFDLNYNDYVTMRCTIDNVEYTFNFLVDTQADICILRRASLFETHNIDTNRTIYIKGITQDSLQSFGTLNIDLNVNHGVITHEFHIVPDDFNVDCDGIIG